MRGTIVVGGSVAQKPGYGGHTWVFLQYLLGFRRLGYDVLLLDRLAPEMCRDRDGLPAAPERSENVRYLAAVMDRFGLGGDWCVMDTGGATLAGLPREEVLRRVRGAPLVNVMGFVEDPAVLEAASLRVFLDIDPGVGQIWRELGLHDAFAGHDRFVTIGERLGRPECPLPTCGLDWITTPQPVVLDLWPAAPPAGATITSVGSWRGANGTLEYRGETYGHRVHEFRRFLALPQMTGRAFEVALAIHAAETDDLERLGAHGWRLADPRDAAGDPDAYQAYIRRSGAELMIAKSLYARSGCGWFSDRSICYLATGRPVIAQDTGIGGLLPTGEGLLTFTTPDEAAAAVEEVFADPARHARAARAIAEEHFDSDRVLGRLLGALEVA